MSGVQERIAEVLEAHRPYGLDCKCGRPINSDADWATHVSAAVVGVLGLTDAETLGAILNECTDSPNFEGTYPDDYVDMADNFLDRFRGATQ
jgi:hypothetical protein